MQSLNKLENIGFYTLSDSRAQNISDKSLLKRCEMILTDKCNFKCPYCRGPQTGLENDIDLSVAMQTLSIWINNKLENIRFSGGEPTLFPFLDLLIKKSKKGNIKNIAVSTNGSASLEYYKYLTICGVNDFSISLDACCPSIGKLMCGNIEGVWEKVVRNIEALSKITYVTVGIVFTKETKDTVVETIKFASSLGVADIRIISSAQFNNFSESLENIPNSVLKKHPILNYRIKNYLSGKNVRGISNKDCYICWLALDDMACSHGLHFPCIIYMREHGNPLGPIDNNIRDERLKWVLSHNSFTDKICKENCLDVCIDFNNKVQFFKEKKL